MRKLFVDFAIASVKGDQAVDLERRLLLGEKIEVVIKGTFQAGSQAWSKHDGIDQEFAIDVTEASLDSEI